MNLNQLIEETLQGVVDSYDDILANLRQYEYDEPLPKCLLNTVLTAIGETANRISPLSNLLWRELHKDNTAGE